MHRLVTLAAQVAKLLGYLGALAVVAMMLHISLDVILRNAFRISLDTVPEIVARYYMTALAFLPLAWLAPDIATAILTGHQPAELSAKRLRDLPDLPLDWATQRRVLGFPAR